MQNNHKNAQCSKLFHTTVPTKVEKLIYNNVLYDNKNDIANVFNQYFVNIGANLANALPSATTNFRSYLGPSIQNSISVNPVTDEKVYNLIASMSGDAAAGDDGFNLEFLKKMQLISLSHSHIYLVCRFFQE